MIQSNYQGQFDGISKVAKRIPFYFMIAAASISMIAVVQYLAWEHMPVWNEDQLNMPSHRMVDLTFSRNGRLVVAEYINVAPRVNLPMGLSVSIVDTVDSSKKTITCAPGIWEGALSPCGKWLATADKDGKVFLLDVEASGGEPRSILNAEIGGKELCWSSDSESLLIVGEQSLVLFNRRSELIVANFPLNHATQFSAPAGASCFLACSNGTYSLFDWHTGDAVQDISIELNARLVTLSTDLRFAAYLVGSNLTLFDLQEDRPLWSRQYRTPSSIKNVIEFTPDDRSLAVVSIIGSTSEDYVINLLGTDSPRDVCIRLPEDEIFTGFQFADKSSVWLWTSNGSISQWNFPSVDDPNKEASRLTQWQQLSVDFE